MKTLLLLRHAKSSWDNDALADFSRPLNDRGRHDAPRMGKLIRREDIVPELIISSSAKRAMTTTELAALEMSFDGEIRYSDKLYLAEPEAYITLARQADDQINILMLVGHNPGIQELVEALTGQDEQMSTAALACIRMPINRWKDLAASKRYELAGFWRPKEL
jgi:phosphohistidine phosphatase